MKKAIVSSSIATALLGVSQMALAAINISNPNPNIESAGIGALITQINRAINYVVPFLVGLGVLVVIYGVFTYIRNAADEEMRQQAKQFMVWGVIGIFVMISIWGLVSVLENTFTFEKSGANIRVPSFEGTGSSAGSFNPGADDIEADTNFNGY